MHVALKDCVAKASDGASVMSGKDNGVQKLFRNKVDKPCVFVHCYAHRLNLVLSVSATEVDLAKEFCEKSYLTSICPPNARQYFQTCS